MNFYQLTCSEGGCSLPTCGSSSSAPPETSWSSQLLPSGAEPDNDHLDEDVDQDYLVEDVYEDVDEDYLDQDDDWLETCSCFGTFDLAECSGLLMETSVSRSS